MSFNLLYPMPIWADAGMETVSSVLPPKEDGGNKKPMSPFFGSWNNSGGLVDNVGPASAPFLGGQNSAPGSLFDPGNPETSAQNVRAMQQQDAQILPQVKTKQMQQPPAGNMPQPTGDPSKLFNFTGLLSNPNILSRLGVGYNMGGLLGALGMGLTDMNPNSAPNRQNQITADQFNQWQRQQQLTNGY